MIDFEVQTIPLSEVLPFAGVSTVGLVIGLFAGAVIVSRKLR